MNLSIIAVAMIVILAPTMIIKIYSSWLVVPTNNEPEPVEVCTWPATDKHSRLVVRRSDCRNIKLSSLRADKPKPAGCELNCKKGN